MDENTICLSYIEAELTYTVDPPYVSSLTPFCGPTGLHTSVTITGENFVSSATTFCVFGTERVNATWISSTSVQCETPAFSSPQVVEFSVQDSRFTYTRTKEET